MPRNKLPKGIRPIHPNLRIRVKYYKCEYCGSSYKDPLSVKPRDNCENCGASLKAPEVVCK